MTDKEMEAYFGELEKQADTTRAIATILVIPILGILSIPVVWMLCGDM